MSKLSSISTGASGAILLNTNNVVSISSIDNNYRSDVYVDGHLNNQKIAKIIKILSNGSIEKIKEIIEADIDPDLNSYLISESNLGDDYLLDIFKIYVKSYNYNPNIEGVFTSIIKKLDTKSSLKKCEDLVRNSLNFPQSLEKILLDKIFIASSKIPNSIDFIKDD